MKRLGYFLILITIVLLPGLFLINSCKHDGITGDKFKPICFTTDVLPTFKNSCGTTGCHDGRGGEQRYAYINAKTIMASITPYDLKKSKAYQAMTSTILLMPPGNALPIEKRTLIMLWIEQGADTTSCESAITTVPPVIKSAISWACYGRDIEPIISGSCAVAGCHLGNSGEDAKDLSSYAKVFAAIEPGNPAASRIYAAVTANAGTEHFMPPRSQTKYAALSKAKTDSIFSWIKKGGLNEQCNSICDTTGNITYASQIQPIVDLNCVGCHGANNPSGGITLLTAANLQPVATSGKLMPSIKRTGLKVMPPTFALTKCEVRDFELWITQGYN